MAHPQTPSLSSCGVETFADAQHGGLVAGDDDGVRAVDGGDGDAFGQALGHLVLGGLEGDHRAARGQCLHQAGARRHEGARVLEGEDAGHVGGREFTDGVTGHEVRAHAPGLHQPEEGHLDREQRGLGESGLVQQLLVTGDHLSQRSVQVEVEARQDGVQRLGEDREAAVQLLAHAQSLRALTREEERRLSARYGPALDDLRGAAAGGERRQALEQLVVVARQDRGPVLEGRAGRGQGVGEVGDRQVGVCRHVRQ